LAFFLVGVYKLDHVEDGHLLHIHQRISKRKEKKERRKKIQKLKKNNNNKNKKFF